MIIVLIVGALSRDTFERPDAATLRSSLTAMCTLLGISADVPTSNTDADLADVCSASVEDLGTGWRLSINPRTADVDAVDLLVKVFGRDTRCLSEEEAKDLGELALDGDIENGSTDRTTWTFDAMGLRIDCKE